MRQRGTLALLSILLSFNASAGLKDLLLSNQSVLDLGLSWSSSQRCKKFASKATDKGQNNSQKKNCSSLWTDFVKILEPTAYATQGRRDVLVFKTDLVRWLSDDRLDFFIHEVESEMQEFRRGSRLDIFQIATKYTRDSSEALNFMAVLFQDTSLSQSHLFWAMGNMKGKAFSRAKSLSSLFREISLSIKDKPQLRSQLILYPAAISGLVNQARTRPNYHFLVPALLAQKLVLAGYSKALAVFSAYHFNYFYEALSTSPSIKLAFNDPFTLKPLASRLDTYFGLLGAVYGTDPNPIVLPEHEFIYLLSKSTQISHNYVIDEILWLQNF
jgi:hypothetical protein